MEGFLIAGIVIGLACIAVSFMVKEDRSLNKEDKDKLIEELRSMLLNEQSIESLVSEAQHRFTETLNDLIADKISEMEDTLDEKTNHKMIALDEMYEGMLSKMDHNHKEVLFLYDMLKQKGEEIKTLSSQIEGMRKALAEEEKKLVLTYQLIHKKMNLLKDSGIDKEKSSALKKQAEERYVSDEKEDSRSERMEEEFERESGYHHSERIIALHKEGRSILDISKELGIGQGEVRLILGLLSKNK